MPIKPRVLCKTRLATALSECQRIDIVRYMLRHVLQTLRATRGIDRVCIVSAERDEVPAEIAVLADAGCGLNACLDAALLSARAAGVTQLLVVPADLPLLHGDDVALLLDAGTRSRFALAPDRHDSGTNAICMDAALPLGFRFGDNSCAAHLAAARALGIAPALVRTDRLAFDLDSECDLSLLRERGYFAMT
ncbi:MAG: 2-phospho-L-lactate guanylyltransferase [Spongiibacteraceae bacterium]